MITAMPNATAASPIPQAISLEPPIGCSPFNRDAVRVLFVRRRMPVQLAVSRGLRTECQAVPDANAADKSSASAVAARRSCRGGRQSGTRVRHCNTDGVVADIAMPGILTQKLQRHPLTQRTADRG